MGFNWQSKSLVLFLHKSLTQWCKSAICEFWVCFSYLKPRAYEYRLCFVKNRLDVVSRQIKKRAMDGGTVSARLVLIVSVRCTHSLTGSNNVGSRANCLINTQMCSRERPGQRQYFAHPPQLFNLLPLLSVQLPGCVAALIGACRVDK